MLTVKEVVSQREKTIEGKGTFVSYRLNVDQDGTLIQGAELFQKQETPAPKPGDTIDGTIETDEKFGPKIKKAQKFTGGGGWRPRDPKETAAIQRQHSQEMALRYLTVRASQGKLPEDFKMDQLRTIIDWFQADIDRERAA